MRLKKILKDVDIIKTINYKNYNIKTITHISADVEKNGMFICIKGNKFDGNSYAKLAQECGAKCIVTEENILVDNATIVVVKDVRIAMSRIAKNFYNNCADKLKIIGIVGTSGKTTTSIITANLLGGNDKNIGIIGTNGIYIGDVKIENKFTTPDPLELHYIFYQMKMLGVKIVVMEVSAQAIFLNKMYGIVLDKCIFTNISPEHLDFFGSMEKYVKCKMDYFDKINMKECVLNVDDFYGMELAYKCNIPRVSYAINNPANSFALNINNSLSGTKFVANILDDVICVDCKFVGEYNVYNILASLTVAKLMGVSKGILQERINSMNPIDGRFNFFCNGDKNVLVDFAHTPDSFEKTLSLIKSFAKGKVITLFGCVGYSDKDKRMEMGQIADKYSDKIILTTDNRGEVDFLDIANDIKLGIEKCEVDLIEDREQAIKFGIDNLGKDEILCLLGKGSEMFQMIGNNRQKYNEIEIVNKYLKGRV